MLDKDGDGHITYVEFSDKITFKDFHHKKDRYMISLKNFTDRVTNEWYTVAANEK